MQFIKATSLHSSQIVELLKLSLGEKTTKKTIEFWNWKHIKNPFGASTTILAFDNDTLIGIRAFMKWKFTNSTTTIICARAVDTAVHPKHQGKGLFTKLTLQAIEELKKDGIDLIYNTPNEISKAGYLKMGWFSIEKLPITISLGKIFYKKYSEITCKQYLNEYSLKNFQPISIKLSNAFVTPINIEYLQWRYMDCPVNMYIFLYKENSFLIVLRLKKVKSFIELRICDVAIADNKNSKIEATTMMNNCINKIKPLLVTSSFAHKSFHSNIFSITKKIGPIVTLRKVAETNHISSFNNFNNWLPSIGCLELF